MNDLTKEYAIQHGVFDKLKYNIEYYKNHKNEKKDYNKWYYRTHKDKWHLVGSLQGTNSGNTKMIEEIYRNKAEEEANKRGLTGPSRDAFIRQYMNNTKSYVVYDEPIGPTKPWKNEWPQRIITDFVMAPINLYKQIKNYKLTQIKKDFTEEDFERLMKKAKAVEMKVTEIENKINDTRNKVYKTIKDMLNV